VSTVTVDEILTRVRIQLSARRARGVAVRQPQALCPLDASEFEPLECYPWRRAVGSLEEISTLELGCAPKETLVPRLFRILLLREPKEQEARRYATLFESGCAPEVLIALLRWSSEGRAVGIEVRGIATSLLPALPRSLARYIRKRISKVQ
jgi:hypothetical protein